MSDNKTITAFKTAFASFLKKEKLRETYERKVIVDMLAGYDSHFTPETLLDQIEMRGEHLSRATVYNTLNLLIRSGLVQRFQFSDGQYHYQISRSIGVSRQVHVICNICGRVSDVKTQSIQKQLSSMNFGTFIPQNITLAVYGLCNKCARRLRSAKASNSQQLNLFS